MPRGKHRNTMVLKIPVDREQVAQAEGSYQKLAGIIFRELRVALGAAIESQREAQRHQAEANRLTAQLAAQIEDHHAEVEVEDDEAGDKTTAVG